MSWEFAEEFNHVERAEYVEHYTIYTFYTA